MSGYQHTAHLVSSIRLSTVPLVYRKTFSTCGDKLATCTVCCSASVALQTSEFFTTSDSATHTSIGLPRRSWIYVLNTWSYGITTHYLLHIWQGCGLLLDVSVLRPIRASASFSSRTDWQTPRSRSWSQNQGSRSWYRSLTVRPRAYHCFLPSSTMPRTWN